MKIRNETDVLVMGGGSWGTALATLLALNGRKTLLWVREKELAEDINKNHKNSIFMPDYDLPPNLKATTDLEKGVRGTPVILMVVPTKFFRSMAAELGDYIEGDQVLVHASKGIEPGTYKRMSQLLKEETCSLKIGVLSGPTLAGEIMMGHPAGAVVASAYNEVIRKVQALYKGSRLKLFGGNDIIGTEIGGSFKNVIAVASGAASGMGFGDNTKSLIITRGLSEMATYGVAVGANVYTFGGLAGIGDLIATCASPLSRNHQVGKALAGGEKTADIINRMTHVAEGVPASKAIYEQATSMGLELPIVKAVYRVVHEDIPVEQALEELLALPAGGELSILRFS